VSVILEQRRPQRCLCGSWRIAYRIHSCSRPPLHLSLSCTRSDMPSPYQHLEQAHRLRDSSMPSGDVLLKLCHPTFGKLTMLARVVCSLTFFQHAEMVWQAGWLAVSHPGGFDDLFPGISTFIGIYLSWSVEMIQRVSIIWLYCSRVSSWFLGIKMQMKIKWQPRQQSVCMEDSSWSSSVSLVQVDVAKGGRK